MPRRAELSTDHQGEPTNFRLLPCSNVAPATQWIIVVLAWGAAALISYSRFFISEWNAGRAQNALAWLLPWLLCFSPWVVSTPLLAAIAVRFPLHTNRWKRNLLAQCALGPPIAAMESLAGSFLFHMANRIGMRQKVALSYLDMFFNLLLYFGAIGILQGMAYLASLRAREREVSALVVRKLQLENDLRDAQLATLRAKLNPHFFFNALQNISALMQTDTPAAERMLVQLSDLLRSALRHDMTQQITLEDELQLTRSYLAIEQVRFQDRLAVHIDTDPDLNDALVPSLLLQPVAENALRHGMANARGQATVRICIRRARDTLCIRVTDNGKGFPRVDSVPLGVGLGILQARLEKLYAGRGRCELRNTEEGGAEVVIRLPYQRQRFAPGVSG
jgi:two-component system LytT family sensor kinase